MKIAFIAAGAANMYCGSCLRDNAVAVGLKKLGHDVILQPLYMPMRVDRDAIVADRIFYGGINIFLQEKFAFFRRFAGFDAIFNSRPLLKLAGKMSGMTQAEDLGALTVSTIRGPAGHQRREVEKLVRWLADEVKPDIVNLPNAMFLGIAKVIREATGVPVICSLNSEDVFLESLVEPYKSEAMEMLRSFAGDVDGLVAISHYYAGKMAAMLDVPRDRIDVVPMGVETKGLGRSGPRPTDPFTIGFLARIDPVKGLHVLCDALAELKKMPGTENARIRAAGYLGPEFKKYLAELRENVRRMGLADSFEFVGEVSFEEKVEFLDSLSVLCVPTVHPEPKGLFLLEAMAHGVPAVQPAEGTFPELIEAAGGGGLLVESNDPKILAEGLHALLRDPGEADRLGEAGRRGVAENLNAELQARATLAVYEKFVG